MRWWLLFSKACLLIRQFLLPLVYSFLCFITLPRERERCGNDNLVRLRADGRDLGRNVQGLLPPSKDRQGPCGQPAGTPMGQVHHNHHCQPPRGEAVIMIMIVTWGTYLNVLPKHCFPAFTSWWCYNSDTAMRILWWWYYNDNTTMMTLRLWHYNDDIMIVTLCSMMKM